ncbi:MAG TPA: hypothetical protein VNR18_08725 [Hyphomicrobiales bacterium]|nr:hypothetical protein [Hyphomicrobiales bacterium]
MNSLRTGLLLLVALAGVDAQAQVANDVATQNAILAALPAGTTAETATADEIAQGATDLAFGMDGELEANLTQVMVSLGEMTRAGRFANAPRFGENNPPGRFYLKALNLASSNLDVSSSTYYSLTVQDIMRVTAAAREGMNFLNDAKSNAITRK